MYKLHCYITTLDTIMIVSTTRLMNLQNRNKYLPLRMKRAVHNLKVQSSENRLDAVGPPDPVSNLRPIVFAIPHDETDLEKTFREARESTQIWNQEFWTKHNARFILERKNFQERQRQAGVSTLTADEMSVFYKEFLDKNWQGHLEYNISWYRKNIGLLFLEIRAKLSRLLMIK